MITTEKFNEICDNSETLNEARLKIAAEAGVTPSLVFWNDGWVDRAYIDGIGGGRHMILTIRESVSTAARKKFFRDARASGKAVGK